jgi:hypothetical protein
LVKDLVRCSPTQYAEPDTTERCAPVVAKAEAEGFPIFKTARIAEWARENSLEIVGFREMRDRMRSKIGN